SDRSRTESVHGVGATGRRRGGSSPSDRSPRLTCSCWRRGCRSGAITAPTPKHSPAAIPAKVQAEPWPIARGFKRRSSTPHRVSRLGSVIDGGANQEPGNSDPRRALQTRDANQKWLTSVY